MGAISEARLGAVRMLIEQAPDNVVRSLDTALQSGRGAAMAEVHDLISAEITDRRICTAVFSPLAPLCRPIADEPAFLPPSAPRLLWAALKKDQPREVAEARRITLAMRRDDGPPQIYDDLCKRCAEGLLSGEAPYDEAARRLGEAASKKLSRGLALTPLARTVEPRLPTWVRSMNGEAAAAVRIAFKDAVEQDPDAAPTLMEMMYGQLEEPWLVLRLISAVMDRPSDRYLAASEMAGFGERLLQDIDRRIDAVRRFDPDEGPQAAVALTGSIQIATIIIAEFEHWLELAKDGPWGSRLVKARKGLAAAVEARLKECPSAVTGALPTYTARSSGKTSRLMPRTTSELDKDAVRRGYALLTLLSESRGPAAHGGFATVRAKVIEELDKQVDLYAEDLIDALHEKGDEDGRLGQFIEVAADYLGLIREPRAAEIVKRRAAVA